MYRNLNNDQLDIYDFILPFGGHLKEDNRWVKLRKMINWEMVREIYGSIFETRMPEGKPIPAMLPSVPCISKASSA